MTTVKDFDLDESLLLTGPGFWERPDRFAAYRRLRNDAPVSWHPEIETPWAPEGGPGFWAVVRYDDVRAVTKNPKVFSSRFGTAPEEWPESRVAALGMLHMDDPEHRIYRQIVGPAFTPRNLDVLIDGMRVNANLAIDEILDQGADADVVPALCHNYPIRIILDMLAMPKDDQQQFIDWTLTAFDVDLEKGTIAHHALIDYGTRMAGVRRADPGDDVLSRIVTAEYEGRGLTDLEVGGFISLLVGAGFETAGSTLGMGIYQLGRHPEQWQLLRERPDLLPNAVGELCRYASPVICFRRTATEDVELGEQRIQAGDKVVIYYESANFDDAVFDEPERFDITRDPRAHFAFGAGGPHQCLGEQLAIRELRVLLEELLRRVDDIEITRELFRPPNRQFNMVKELRATFV